MTMFRCVSFVIAMTAMIAACGKVQSGADVKGLDLGNSGAVGASGQSSLSGSFSINVANRGQAELSFTVKRADATKASFSSKIVSASEQLRSALSEDSNVELTSTDGTTYSDANITVRITTQGSEVTSYYGQTTLAGPGTGTDGRPAQSGSDSRPPLDSSHKSESSGSEGASGHVPGDDEMTEQQSQNLEKARIDTCGSSTDKPSGSNWTKDEFGNDQCQYKSADGKTGAVIISHATSHAHGK